MRASSILSVVLLLVGLASGFLLGSAISVHTSTVISAVAETTTLELERAVTVFEPTTVVSVVEGAPKTITVTITETAHRTTRDVDASCITFKTGRDVYKSSEEVTLILENKCGRALMLPNAAPWMIIDIDGDVVFSPIAAQVITEVGPGNLITWTWSQVDNEGRRVPAGTYRVRLATLNAGTFTAEFMIVE